MGAIKDAVSWLITVAFAAACQTFTVWFGTLLNPDIGWAVWPLWKAMMLILLVFAVGGASVILTRK